MTYIGHGTGATQLLYAMAKSPDYYANRLHRFIGISPVYEYELIPKEMFDSHDVWKQ